MGCSNHNPVQHRDGKAPWCRECGLTENYHQPKSVFDEEADVNPGPTPDVALDLKLSDKSLETAVYESLGAASVCWTNMNGVGTFLSERALQIAEQLMARIRQEDGDE